MNKEGIYPPNMATANPGPGPEHLHCLLCTREYDVPRTLPCHHTYCEKCLSSYIESVGLEKTDSGTQFDCPACRRCIEVSDFSLSEGEIARSFPLNTLYVSLSSSSDDKECDACRRTSEKQAAVYWCNDCGEALCTECYTAHRKLRLTSKHKVVDIDDYEQQILYLGELHGDCPKHPGKAVEIFCLVHREPCCSVCVPTLHSGCKPISSVEDIGKRFSKYPNKFSCLPELEHMRTHAKTISDEEESHLARLDNEYTDIMSSMDRLIRKAKSNLDFLHQFFKENTKEKWDSKKQKLKDVQSDSRMLQTNIENCVKIISVMTDRASPEDQFLIQEQLKVQISSHSQVMHSKMNNYKETRMRLEPESVVERLAHSLNGIGFIIYTESPSISIQDALSKMDENIGILKQKPLTSLMEDSVYTSEMPGSLVRVQPVGATEGGGDLTGRSVVTSQPEGATGGGGDMMKGTAKKMKSVARYDIGCGRISGAAFLADGNLLLSDFNDKQLVLCDAEFHVVTKTKLQESPEYIAYSDKHRTVLVRTETGILKYSVTGAGLQYTGKITLPTRSMNYCGIAVHNDTIVVGTGNSVQLLTMDGTVQKTIPRTGTHTYVAVCGARKRFCYPDNNVIVCCDIDGTEMFRYSDTNLANIRGLAFDRWGHIYVCCWNPKYHVYQICPGGQKGRVLRLDQSNISRPWGIVRHPTKDELVVTSLSTENVALEVFTLT